MNSNKPITLNSTTANISKEMIHATSWLSLIAYYPSREVNNELKDKLNIHSRVSHLRELKKTKSDTELFVFSKPDESNSKNGVVIVGVRGSEPSSFNDWIFTDLYFKRTPAFGIKSSGQFIHAGFNAALKSISLQLVDEIIERTAEFDNYKLVITGHSLGGALSILIGASLLKLKEDAVSLTDKQIYNKLIDNLIIHTFGQPRVGNKAFCDWYDDNLKLVTYRHVYWLDIVPRVPSKSAFPSNKSEYKSWKHCGNLIHYSKKGDVDITNHHKDLKDLFFHGIRRPFSIRLAAHNHVPWAYLWCGEGQLTGKPKLFRPKEELRYFAKFAINARRRLTRDYIMKFIPKRLLGS
jgi:hypothetical protein